MYGNRAGEVLQDVLDEKSLSLRVNSMIKASLYRNINYDSNDDISSVQFYSDDTRRSLSLTINITRDINGRVTRIDSVI